MINPLIKIIELFVDEEQDAILQSISIVDKPAIEREFMYFSEDGRAMLYFQEEGDQRIVVSPAMIPGKKIARKDKDTGELYYVYFSKETVALAAEYLMKYNKQSHSNVNHQRIYSNDMYVMESWIKESENDKSSDYGFGDLPVGTWFVKFRILNDDVWKKIKSGELKGLSVEGDFLLGTEKYEKAFAANPYAEVRKKYANAYKGLSQSDADKLDQIMLMVEMEIEVGSLPDYVNQGETGPEDMDWEDWVDMDEMEFQESYTDYPNSATNNAKKALEWRSKYPNEIQGGTQIGWTRANQLANRRPISEETIARMASFARHRRNSEVDPAKRDKPWTDAGYVAWLIWGGESGVSWANRKLVSIRREAQRMSEEVCPVATQDIKVNLANRQEAIDTANYGPLNPNEPNEVYWEAKADMFGASVETAKSALCGNCAFFVTTPTMLDCIAEGIGREGQDPYDLIEAGQLGYCEAFDFKCAAARTCDAWVVMAKQEDFAPQPASGNKGDRPLARIPKEDRGRTGSAKNKPGDSTTTRGGTTVPDSVEKTLKDKIAIHNEQNPQDSQKATLGMLKAVWRRGAGAYSVGTPGRRSMTRPQWSMGRVNAFLNILAGNKSGYDKDYTQDNDLLPASHPKSSKG